MALAHVISFHNGGVMQEVDAGTPAEIATNLGISMDNTSIFVDDKQVKGSHELRDGDVVSFQKSSTKSGMKVLVRNR
jgi:hypothetical protein|tara:strand:- start:346 stop:576 length:231 start_codon:yes stop_codon:yes gene_type:complete